MADVLSMALIERKGRLLAIRKKEDATPFAGRWLLPSVVVAEQDSAEEALDSHGFHDLNVEFGPKQFAETLSLLDEADGKRHVANVFKVASYEGEMRFRAASDYEDARWLTSDELSGIQMPDALREWLQTGRYRPEAPKMAPVVTGEVAPDNRTAWNAISRAYQDRYQISMESIEWGPRCPMDMDGYLLGDVSGKRVIVVGCGGGQDCVVLARRGAQVIGIDLSDKQIEYGRRLADREGVLVTLLQGNAEQLKEIEDQSQDLAISAHALNYVEHADRAFAEVYRVLKPGSTFVFSVNHPFSATLAGGPPFEVARSYWAVQQDWQWELLEQGQARFRSWDRPVSEWFALLKGAGFQVDELLEPETVDEGESTWDGSYDREKMRLIPTTLIFKATKR